MRASPPEADSTSFARTPGVWSFGFRVESLGSRV